MERTARIIGGLVFLVLGLANFVMGIPIVGVILIIVSIVAMFTNAGD